MWPAPWREDGQLDDDILQDFLIEAQEILDQLDTQLIDLEHAPEDHDLLNAVFRGFHTIKGGAGFLSLEALVEVAHKAEDVFDLMRNGQAQLTPAVMDLFLRVLDVLRGQFEELNAGSEPGTAPPDLIAALKAIVTGDVAPSTEEDTASAASDGEFDEVVAQMVDEDEPGASNATEGVATEAADPDLITDDEFDALLDKLHKDDKAPATALPPSSESDEITDDEFDALLDKLQAGKASSQTDEAVAANAGGDEIGEDEFEDLLDNLHGTGQFKREQKAAAQSDADEQATTPVASEAPAAAPTAEVANAEHPKAAPPAKKPAAAKGADTADGAKPQANKETTVRVETEILDRIMNMVGELVLIRNRLSNLQAEVEHPDVNQTISNLDVVTSDLQMAAMKTRMQPIKKVFGRFPRVIRDLARNLKKEIKLEMSGEDTDLDKNLVEALADPLVHLVRNAVDHGIEDPDTRAAADKPRAGTVYLSAEQSGDQILLIIKDDGKGMDAESLRTKVVEKGLIDIDAAGRLSERECYELIFLPGFSTKEQISDVSGRGVGMDVVKTRITQLNGSIEIDSELGVGTTIRIRLPLTLAILPTLMVVLGKQIFALPLVNVKEIIDFEISQSRDVNGNKTLVSRGQALPLFYLSRWLVKGVTDTMVDAGHVVIVTVGNQQLALVVDELIGQEEVVIKPLGAMLDTTKGFAGATITGNGRIALIIDLPELIDAYARF